jgi:inositol 1,4,5-triphosphate receptor type 1
MWNYLYYKGYLQDKEETEFNGNESYIIKKIRNSDLNWFPIKRTKSLTEEDQDNDKLNSVIKAVQ